MGSEKAKIVTWLHERAKEMNDPHAIEIINLLADDFGRGWIPKGLKTRNTPECLKARQAEKT